MQRRHLAATVAVATLPVVARRLPCRWSRFCWRPSCFKVPRAKIGGARVGEKQVRACLGGERAGIAKPFPG